MIEGNHPYDGDPLERWKVFHRLFFVQILGIVRECLVYSHLVATDAGLAAESASVRRVIRQLYGSAAALRLAGDFAPEQYGDVRDNMAAVDPGFSGLWSADHMQMLIGLRRLRELIKSDPTLHDELGRALDVCYEAHAWVCERFVGKKKSMAQAANHGEHDDDATEGVESLRGFYKNRAFKAIGAKKR